MVNERTSIVTEGASPPAIPLANVYREGVALEDYWVSEKLDGVRTVKALSF